MRQMKRQRHALRKNQDPWSKFAQPKSLAFVVEAREADVLQGIWSCFRQRWVNFRHWLGHFNLS